MNDKIIIKGARENNLKNIDLEIPRDKLVVMTGVSAQPFGPTIAISGSRSSITTGSAKLLKPAILI